MRYESLPEWLEYIESLHVKKIDMGLTRVREVAERLAVLQPGRRNIIVAGTNGKGSTAVFTEALARAQGMSVGTTLSPHVQAFNERVRIDGESLDDSTLCAGFAEVEFARREIALTYFEFATLVALLAFKQAGVDLAILEVGLGGRLDAFNIVDADLAIVTSIGLDHEEFLGGDIEQIGIEKAGVFRPGQKVVLGSVTRSVVERAVKLECDILQLDADFAVQETADEWSICGQNGAWRDFPRGNLAPVNCALGVLAASTLAALSRAHILQALAQARLPGRLEQVTLTECDVYLDVAHNPAGAAFLSAQLAIRFPGRKFVAVLCMLDNKDAAGVTAALRGTVKRWLTIASLGDRARSSSDLAAAVSASVGAEEAIACESMAEALSHAQSFTLDDDGILVLGSFSAVEQARNLIDSDFVSKQAAVGEWQ